MKILVVKLSALGDVVQTLPSLTLLKQSLKEAEVHWVVDERNASLLKNHPYIKKLFVFSNSFFKHPLKFWAFLRKLRRETYDVVIDYQGLLKSGVITFFAKAGIKAGFLKAREGSQLFYSFKLDVPFEIHAVKRYLLLTKEVLNQLGAKGDFNFIPEAKLTSKDYPTPEEPFIVIIPEARWKTKLYPLFLWEEILKSPFFRKKGFKFLILASGKNKEIQNWAQELEKRDKSVVSLVGRLSLPQVVGVIKRASLVLTVDTGPMHIASALGVPLVALFGPTSPERTGPWGTRFKVLKSPLSCSPCFKKQCEKKAECMQAISSSEVISAAKELLSAV